jgi:hypothetical protein
VVLGARQPSGTIASQRAVFQTNESGSDATDVWVVHAQSADVPLCSALGFDASDALDEKLMESADRSNVTTRPDVATQLRIEEREFEAGGVNQSCTLRGFRRTRVAANSRLRCPKPA